jgi:hypothetical protein
LFLSNYVGLCPLGSITHDNDTIVDADYDDGYRFHVRLADNYSEILTYYIGNNDFFHIQDLHGNLLNPDGWPWPLPEMVLTQEQTEDRLWQTGGAARWYIYDPEFNKTIGGILYYGYETHTWPELNGGESHTGYIWVNTITGEFETYNNPLFYWFDNPFFANIDYITVKGVQYDTSLDALSLKDMGLTDDDLLPLKYMRNLKYLDLSPRPSCCHDIDVMLRNNITDITPLASLTGLEYLNLNGMRITDITPLSELVNLQNLSLSGNPIGDLTPLANLTELTWLDLQACQISDITSLSSLTNLTYLNLNTNQITDVSPLSGLLQLNTAQLTDNHITDWSPVDHVPNVRRPD